MSSWWVGAGTGGGTQQAQRVALLLWMRVAQGGTPAHRHLRLSQLCNVRCSNAQAVATLGPVAVAYNVVSDFRLYKGGVYTKAPGTCGTNTSINHGVRGQHVVRLSAVHRLPASRQELDACWMFLVPKHVRDSSFQAHETRSQVLIVGYDTVPANGDPPHFICKNSWGTE